MATRGERVVQRPMQDWLSVLPATSRSSEALLLDLLLL